MTLSQLHTALLRFEAQAMAEGLSPEEAARLFPWWLNCPRENCFVTGLFVDYPECLHPPQ